MNKVQDIDPALVAPTSYKPSVRELLAELAALIARHALPEPYDVGVGKLGASVHLRSTTEVDAWAEVMSRETLSTLVEDSADPFWAYQCHGSLLGGAFLSVSVYHRIPTGDELVAQPAVQS